jgi:hypothetical protein
LERKIVLCIGTEDPSSSQHCQKVFKKDESPPQSKKISTKNHSTSTIRHESLIEAPDAKLFLCKIDRQMCIG